MACNHGTGHNLEEAFWPWALTFMADHTRGEMALSYGGGLPEIFPDYCSVASTGVEDD